MILELLADLLAPKLLEKLKVHKGGTMVIESNRKTCDICGAEYLAEENPERFSIVKFHKGKQLGEFELCPVCQEKLNEAVAKSAILSKGDI